MNELEYQETYDFLAKILKDNGMDWVATQVAEHVRNGKTIQKEINTLKEDRYYQWVSNELQPSRFRKGERDTFPVVEEYEPRERLILLINAIQSVVVDTIWIENEVLEYIDENWGNQEGIEFVSDEPGTEPRRLTTEALKSRVECGQNLEDLLNTIRKEAQGQ